MSSMLNSLSPDTITAFMLLKPFASMRCYELANTTRCRRFSQLGTEDTVAQTHAFRKREALLQSTDRIDSDRFRNLFQIGILHLLGGECMQEGYLFRQIPHLSVQFAATFGS